MSLFEIIQQNKAKLQAELVQREKERKENLQQEERYLKTSANLVPSPSSPTSKSRRLKLNQTASSSGQQSDPFRVKPPVPSAQPQAFYPTSRLQQVEERILRFFANVNHRLNGRPRYQNQKPVWSVFPTQQAAFDFADSKDPEGKWLRIFSMEIGEAGRRKFLTTSYEQFWNRYKDMLPHHRHYYEIIRQGSPCHLYLDLEYKIPDNPDIDGVAAVDAVISLLKEWFEKKFKLDIDPDDTILEFDSSTPTKFSRHIILLLPQNKAFAHNAHVGVFINELCDYAAAHKDQDPRCAKLFVKKSDGTESLFIDLGVYSKNRAFRLYLSSKFNSEACLLPTNRFKTRPGVGKCQKDIFMESIICNIHDDVDGDAGELLHTFDESAAAEFGARGGSNGAYTTARPQYSSSSKHLSYGPSPYHPLLDLFIESICREDGGQGRIRSWASIDSDYSLLIFNISGYRWCGNVGRQHKSNGIFVVVDVQQGVWFQKCYDPDCRQYRSPAMPLPVEILDSIASFSRVQQQQTLNKGATIPATPWEEGDDQLAEEELLAIEQAEAQYIMSKTDIFM